MIKKISLSLMSLVLLLPMLSVSAANSTEVEPGVFVNKLTEDQISEIYETNSLQFPAKFNTEYVGEIIEDLTLYKTEEKIEPDGTINKYDYYHVNYKDSKEANLIKEQIDSNKNTMNRDVSPQAIKNEEGDFRIVTTFEPLVEKTKFDSVKKDLYKNLAIKSFEKYFSLLSGKFISNYVVGFFVGELQSDLVAGFEGSADATAYFRLAKKTGQVYRNNSFKSYFTTYQQEWYWKVETITYNKDGNVKRAQTTYYTPQSAGTSYKPINWVYSGYFNDNTQIAEVAQYQYRVEPNRSVPVDDFLKYEGYRNDWKTPGTMSY
ncbi:hypothetical protein A8L34_18875 [Bacillus sp. FJAT-27264]|uniref:hypothetical protein n=1 Tax=Paenibacillus sp. (strain DSM 101736 / FJAT-27264) TaxID=1850362 RepID=UPI000807DAB8|nr:hypothetical protein [Bacillus sp. FJAT-27264]OBZ10646.1 hypothetical protein A8L34_18875 [Bacillus sp. FJAT-27264]